MRFGVPVLTCAFVAWRQPTALAVRPERDLNMEFVMSEANHTTRDVGKLCCATNVEVPPAVIMVENTALDGDVAQRGCLMYIALTEPEENCNGEAFLNSPKYCAAAKEEYDHRKTRMMHK